MTRPGSCHALIRLQHRINHHHIGLSSAHEKEYLRLGAAACFAYFFLRRPAISIAAIAGQLLQIGFRQALQNPSVSSFRVIAFKR